MGFFKKGFLVVVLSAVLLGCGSSGSSLSSSETSSSVQAGLPDLNLGPSVLVANRDSGTVSVIDAATDNVTHTITLPAGTNRPAASYISYSANQNQIFVGDDSNARIAVFDGSTLGLIWVLELPQDCFHIWNNGVQLWAVDRVDKSLVVFDLSTGAQLGIVSIPADLEAAGGVPHDVVVDSDAAYVTILGLPGPDMVVKYSTQTLGELGRAPVGDDPHVILHPLDQRLFVACQDTDNVFVLNRDTLAQQNIVPLLGGHGVWIPAHGQALYVTNFPSHETPGTPGPGARGLFSVDLTTETESGSIVTVSRAHNLVSTPDGNKLYLTHSNGQTSVTVFDTNTADRLPRNPREITVGDNPFGIAFMP